MKTTPIIIALLFFNVLSYAFEYQYRDLDRDGVNDFFKDANGDGLNDMDLSPYPHDFQFKDRNKDGLNDLFIDADGDGVNDIPGTPWPVLDYDRNMKNDISGLPFFHNWFNGFRYGFVIEENQTVIDSFQDNNNDGMDDRVHPHQIRETMKFRNQDCFFDRNRDGMNDHFIRRKRGPFAPRPPRRPVHRP